MPNDTLAAVAPQTAVENLGQLHGIPTVPVAVLPTTRDGHTVYHVAVTEADAEQWRAAFGAPAYAPEHQLHYTTHRSRVLWMGIEVRLNYATH